jgi:hypothetical protein
MDAPPSPLQFQLTAEDFVSSCLQAARRTGYYRRLLRTQTVIWCALVLAVAALFVFAHAGRVLTAMVVLLCAFGVFVGVRRFPRSLARTYHLYATFYERPFPQTREVSLTKAGLVSGSDRGEQLCVPWTLVEAPLLAKEAIYLFHDKSSVVMVPKRAFATPQLEADFLQAVISYLQGPAVPAQVPAPS